VYAVRSDKNEKTAFQRDSKRRLSLKNQILSSASGVDIGKPLDMNGLEKISSFLEIHDPPLQLFLPIPIK